jgi:mRNA interferase MazF
VVQSDPLNRSRLATVIVAAITSNLDWAGAPSSVFLPASLTGLNRDSVANLTQIATISRWELLEPAGHVPPELMTQINKALTQVLGV